MIVRLLPGRQVPRMPRQMPVIFATENPSSRRASEWRLLAPSTVGPLHCSHLMTLNPTRRLDTKINAYFRTLVPKKRLISPPMSKAKGN